MLTSCADSMVRAAGAAVAVGAFAASAAGQAMFQGLGDLPGGGFNSRPDAISRDGTVVVGLGTSTGSTSGWCPFRWTAAGGMQELPPIPGWTPYQGSAYGVSADGSVVAGYWTKVTGNTGIGQAFRWTAATGTVGLGDACPTQEDNSVAWTISGDGQIVAGSSDDDCVPSQPRTRPARWSYPGPAQILASPPCCTAFECRVSAASGDGSWLVGYANTGTTGPGGVANQVAVLWTNGSPTVLANLGGTAPHAAAYAISADGARIAGESRGPSGIEAVLWTSGGTVTRLGGLTGTPGLMISEAWAISTDGSVVGGEAADPSATMYTGFDSAFVWDQQHGLRRVSDILEGAGVNLAGWHLGAVRGIAGDNRTIIGWGVNPSFQHEAWIARLPGEPCYANCDASTTPPVLNVADFTCFLQKWAAADPYADCSGCDPPPCFNVLDFTCFLQKFAAGCP